MLKKLIYFASMLLIYSCSNNAELNKTKILTLGIIHQKHVNSCYGYNDILNVMNTYKPDLICVEIRPEDFRKKTYLQEMMLATAFGDMKHIRVLPIDWWDDKNNDREIRDSLSKIDKYIKLMNKADSLENNDKLIVNFNKKYGENIYQNNSLDINFWNGKEYCDLVREGYKISVSVFGNSPFNLHYISRNQKMVENIKNGISKYKPKRVIVLCGAEHKSFFDDTLQAYKNISILTLSNLKRIEPINMALVVDQLRPAQYFSDVDTSKIDRFYDLLVLPYIHGPDMDFKPEIINLKYLPSVEVMLKNWGKEKTSHEGLVYEWAWFNFLSGEYNKAIVCCNQYIESCTVKGIKGNVFNENDAYRVMGFCYDMKNERSKAIECYKKARAGYLKNALPDWKIKSFLEDYENKPFMR